MAKNKKYYWLKFKEDFFDNDDIKLIEAEPNGKDYIIFYLKLQLKSLKSEGILKYKGVVPYTPKMLANITNTNVDIVKSAIKIFQDLKMIEVWDDGTLYMSELQNLIGSEGESAKRVRKHREEKNKQIELEKLKALQCNNEVTNVTLHNEQCNTEIEIEKDIYKEQQHIPESNKKVNTKSKKINSNSKDVVVAELKNKIESVIKSEIKPDGLKRLLDKCDMDTINLYLDNWDKFKYANKDNPTGYFISACINKYTIPKPEKGITARNKPVQATNYSQREYPEEFWDELYENADNIKYLKNEEEEKPKDYSNDEFMKIIKDGDG